MPAGFKANVEVHAWGAAGGGGYTSIGGGGGYAKSYLTINSGDLVEIGVGEGGKRSVGGASSIGGKGGGAAVTRTSTISQTFESRVVYNPESIANGYFTRTAASQSSSSANVRQYYVRSNGVTVWSSSTPPPGIYKSGTYRGSVYSRDVGGPGGGDFLNAFDLIRETVSESIVTTASEFAGGNAADGQDPDYDRDMGPGGGGGEATYVKINGTIVLVAAGGGGGGGPPEEFGRGNDGFPGTNSLSTSLRSGSTRGGNSSRGASTGGGGGGGYYGGIGGTSRGDDQAAADGGRGGQNYGDVTLSGTTFQPGGRTTTYYPGLAVGSGARFSNGNNGFLVLIVEKSFTASIKDSTWKKITRAAVKVNGVWKNIVSAWTKIDGSWVAINANATLGDLTKENRYSVPGTYTYTVPAGKTKVLLDVIGSTLSDKSTELLQGSTAGIYHKGTIKTVTPGEQLSITVGSTGNTTVTGTFGTLSSSGINDTGGNPVSSGAWGGLINTYGIWRTGINTTDNWYWRIYFPESGSYIFSSSIDNSGTIYVDGTSILSVSGFKIGYNATVNITSGLHLVRMQATDVGVIAGAALVIYDANNKIIFNTREISTSGYVSIVS